MVQLPFTVSSIVIFIFFICQSITCIHILQQLYTQGDCHGEIREQISYYYVDRCIGIDSGFGERYYTGTCDSKNPIIFQCGTDSTCSNCTKYIEPGNQCFRNSLWYCDDGTKTNSTKTLLSTYRFDDSQCNGNPYMRTDYTDICYDQTSPQQEPYCTKLTCDTSRGFLRHIWGYVHGCPSSKPGHASSISEGCNNWRYESAYTFGCLKPDPLGASKT